ncbi:MAG TPA: hypothetical protein VNA13_03725 [Xanthomonadales bacterium]|nr:hypothetical protein [Xanthomonadales bacterium]
MKNTLLGIIIIITVIAAVVAFNITGKMLKDQAIDGCYQTGRLEFTNGAGQKANVPDNFWFNECMKKKGYSK